MFKNRKFLKDEINGSNGPERLRTYFSILFVMFRTHPCYTAFTYSSVDFLCDQILSAWEDWEPARSIGMPTQAAGDNGTKRFARRLPTLWAIIGVLELLVSRQTRWFYETFISKSGKSENL